MKYQRLKPSDCKDIAIWKSKFVAKTQFLLLILNIINCLLKKQGESTGCNKSVFKSKVELLSL